MNRCYIDMYGLIKKRADKRKNQISNYAESKYEKSANAQKT